jgi:isopenicillin N synthase-like dioxygenase
MDVNVQALSEREGAAVPSQFIRTMQEQATFAPHDDFCEQIPVIDLAGLSGNQQENSITMASIASASEDWGFFQVINHGISLALVESTQKLAREFFNLPLEDKQKYAENPNDLIPQGYGRGFRMPESTILDWHDIFLHYFLPLSLKNISTWPHKPAAYRETMDKYGKEVLKFTDKMLEIFSRLLGLQPNYLKEEFGDPMLNIRLIFYPPCPQPKLVLGLGAHSDPNIMSVLLQDETGGLQVKKGNKWVGVAPVPNALVINIGDQLQVVSNGRFQSVEHRVVTNTSAARLSVTTFLHPDADVMLGPALDLVDASHPPLYPTTKYSDYRRAFHRKGLNSKVLVKPAGR